jgi:hypothetical protein
VKAALAGHRLPRLLARVRVGLAAGLLWAATDARAADPAATAAAPPARREYQTVVRARRAPEVPGATRVDADEGRRLAGTADDSLRAVEAAPGVARAALGSGQLVLWGAAPQDTRVLLDELELPALYHLGGLRTVVPTALVKEVALLPGAYGAELGRALGGVVRVTTQPPGEGIHGTLAVDPLDAAASLSLQLGARLRLLIAGRYSYLDRLLQQVAGDRVGDAFPLPRYYDYQLLATLALRSGEQLTATLLAAGDELRRAHATADAALAQSETWQRTFYRASLRYQRRAAAGDELSLTPWFGFDAEQYVAAFGLVPSQLASQTYRYGLRAHYQQTLSRRVSLAMGLDAQGALAMLSRQGTLTRPARAGDRAVFGQPPGSEVNADSYSTHLGDLSPYGALTLRRGPLTVTAGLRLGAHILEVSRLTPRVGATLPIGGRRFAWVAEPRLLVSVQPTAPLTLSAAAGLYHQPPAAEDLSAVFGNPQLGLARAVHVTAGATVQVGSALQLELCGFYRHLDSLAARSPLPTPPLSAVLTADGSGQSYGGQLLVRLRRWRSLSGWVAYTLSRSERTDTQGGAPYLFDLDQTHILTAVGSYELRGFGFGLRLRYSSGFPRTPVRDAFYDARDDVYQPVFGALNSIRLPDFVQLDLRVDRTFALRRLAVVLYLEVQNLTYQKNAEEIVYRFDYASHDYITGLPILAILGARLSL